MGRSRPSTALRGDAASSQSARGVGHRRARFMMVGRTYLPMRDETAHEWGTQNGFMGGPPANRHFTFWSLRDEKSLDETLRL